MILKLYELNSLDMSKLILKYKEKLNINSDEAIVLIEFLNEFQINKEITEEMVLNHLNIDKEKGENIFAHLYQLNLIEIYLNTENGKMSQAFKIDHLCTLLEDFINSNDNLNASDNDLNDLYDYFEKNLGRSLIANEIKLIQEWVYDYKIERTEIIDKASEIDAKNKGISFTTLQKKLFQKKEKPKNQVSDKALKFYEMMDGNN